MRYTIKVRDRTYQISVEDVARALCKLARGCRTETCAISVRKLLTELGIDRDVKLAGNLLWWMKYILVEQLGVTLERRGPS
jgi:hypothetical protein